MNGADFHTEKPFMAPHLELIQHETQGAPLENPG